jgi:hypothetical protein
MAAILKHHTAQIIPLNRTLVQNAANGRKEPMLLKNSCLIEGSIADSIPLLIGGFGDVGTEAGSTGSIVL